MHKEKVRELDCNLETGRKEGCMRFGRLLITDPVSRHPAVQKASWLGRTRLPAFQYGQCVLCPVCCICQAEVKWPMSWHLVGTVSMGMPCTAEIFPGAEPTKGQGIFLASLPGISAQPIMVQEPVVPIIQDGKKLRSRLDVCFGRRTWQSRR